MLILKLWNYLRGYVIIRIEGLSLEKFINACIQKGIYLWDIRRLNHVTLEAKVGIGGYKILKKFSRRCGCKVYITQKSGYPFWIFKVKKRKMLLGGAFFSLILLIFFSSFIYSIEIIGNERLADDEIKTMLEDAGLKVGANRYLIDIRNIENHLMIQAEDLAWVGIEIKGIFAKVEVVEKILSPPKIDKDTPCHVVAAKNGMIEKVLAKNGDALVKQGDIVTEGDILITGIIERETMDHPISLHAYGEVYAKTYYEVNKQMPLIRAVEEKTGEKFEKKVIQLGTLEISLGSNEIPFDSYVVEKTSKKLFQWRNTDFTVEIVREDYFETIEEEEQLSIEEIKTKIHEESINELMEEIPQEAEIIRTLVDFNQVGDTLHGKVMIEVVENIAIQKKIQIEED